MPASGQNGSHKALRLQGLELGLRAGCVKLDSGKGTEKLTHTETQLQERGAQQEGGGQEARVHLMGSRETQTENCVGT